MNPIVETLRVLGALMVLTHHYTYQLSPDLATDWSSLHFFHNGVDLFFVITGYLFAPFLLGDKPVVAHRFLKRRFFRLYPLYLLSLFTFVITATEQSPGVATLLQHVLLLQALPGNTLAESGAISLVYWTLAVEFQFYLFVIAVAWLYRQIDMRHKGAFLLVTALAGCFSSTYLDLQPQNEQWVLWQAQLPALLIEFLLGALIYRYLPALRGTFRPAALYVFGCLLLWALYLYYPRMAAWSLSARPFAWFNLLSAVGYAAVMASLLAWQSQVAENDWRYRRARIVAIFTGSLSYAVYLFHEIVIRWFLFVALSNELRVFMALIVTLILAWLLHRLVENPLREYGRR
jgi:peptidoglycan/LPS O-acetylase OafA/YrhL